MVGLYFREFHVRKYVSEATMIDMYGKIAGRLIPRSFVFSSIELPSKWLNISNNIKF